MNDSPYDPSTASMLDEAVRLVRQFEDGGEEAVQRVRAALGPLASLQHDVALRVVALEAGHPTWWAVRLAHRLEARPLDARRNELRRALHFGHDLTVRALLDRNWGLPGDDLALRIALLDLPYLEEIITRDPAAATQPVRGWAPLAHLAFSRYAARATVERRREREKISVAMAELLVKHGADVNASVPAEPGSTHRLSVLYGALGHAGNLPLARWLLEHGADPNDHESLYHATELDGADAVAMLLAHGARPEGTNALLRAIDRGNVGAVEALLAAGADPNGVVASHPSGEPVPDVVPLHHAALHHAPSRIVAALLEAGADPSREWNGRTAYQTAQVCGAHDVAIALTEAGVATPVTSFEAHLASCAEGVVPEVPLDLSASSLEDRTLVRRVAAIPGRAAHLEALLASGYEVDAADEMGMTALHVALWQGLPDAVTVLLEHGADPAHVNAYGGDAMSTLLHGAEFCPDAAGRDYVACARALWARGVRPAWTDLEGCAHVELVSELATWLDVEWMTAR